MAPAGIGKTAFTVVEALALVSGRRLLRDDVYGGPYRVRLWNLEEPRAEMQRRLEAARAHYKLSLPAGLFLSDGFQQPLCLAHGHRDGTNTDRKLSDQLIRSLRRQRIDVLIIDPFVSCHRVAENDNGAIDAVVKEWAYIAHEAQCAVQLVHHTGKVNGDVTGDNARGASSLIGGVRVARVLNRMSKETANELGLQDPWRYLRVDDAKSNYAPLSEDKRWFALATQPLGNGDDVGVVTTFNPPDPLAGITVDHLDEVVRRARKGRFREHAAANDWIGDMVAEVIDADLKHNSGKAKVKRCLDMWLKSGALKIEERKVNGRDCKFIVAGLEAGR